MSNPSPPDTDVALRDDLRRHLPFSQMEPAHVDLFLQHARPRAFAAGQHVLGPADGVVECLYLVLDGAISGVLGPADGNDGGFQYERGDMFPVAALRERRPVAATYTAQVATRCLVIGREPAQALAAVSAPFADVLLRRLPRFADASRQAMQAALVSRTLSAQSLETRLGDLCRGAPEACLPSTPLADALARMSRRGIGSIVVTDEAQAPVGIFTRHDLLDRVTLAQVPLSTPIERVMSAPLHSLSDEHTAQDAALLMARHGARHVPVTRGGRLVGLVSERDLFALQRLSLNQLSTELRRAPDLPTLQSLAQDLRQFARNLLGQGVQAKQLTELVSHLNDVLTERLVTLVAARHGRDMTRACWLAFGSEGRSEQTIATDQDNGLIFESDDPDADRPAWLAFAREVNEGLDACGYPLCRGNVMASNPECCLTPDEWRRRFGRWIAQGSPEDLLAANIYFDLRPLAGNLALATPLREFIVEHARGATRFGHLLAEDLLRRRVPLTWLGGIDARLVDGVPVVDLKLLGTAIFVDVARLLCLMLGLSEVNTRRRLEAIARAQHVDAHQAEAWVTAFEFLQMLRLRAQLDGLAPPGAGNPNLVRLDALNDIDRRMLKECFRVARRLQQRVELDYVR
ncbi:CBS domain-containing protein [Caldimonas thermodepolymerans]|uniref:Nucleotidyltransferase n=1 Tax=Caldimonas thermodepolymerans TaxID=215580 RepID=A0A2S5T2A1_9BURK|nr:DUF294 nucleotidyltransferase-like domain-containing protein [Caldimonas thermodepolymerans]PPE69110.1 nucleotidyltransferase [Caldimonas thermodepolymerans]QPC32064.1 CBS domain-containing protein [Caldimonas thermodepolymerans]RDH95923.1 CBS domain-containing protein [Caldimonas thermodepolymerans]